jgi:hypothetical protein
MEAHPVLLREQLCVCVVGSGTDTCCTSMCSCLMGLLAYAQGGWGAGGWGCVYPVVASCGLCGRACLCVHGCVQVHAFCKCLLMLLQRHCGGACCMCSTPICVFLCPMQAEVGVIQQLDCVSCSDCMKGSAALS